jgi:hypothetical protein
LGKAIGTLIFRENNRKDIEFTDKILFAVGFNTQEPARSLRGGGSAAGLLIKKRQTLYYTLGLDINPHIRYFIVITVS